MFRLVQEALNNVKRHSDATQLNVSIISADSHVRIVISDNGKGFRLPQNVAKLANVGKLGIIGMYERAQSIGAGLDLSTQPGKGTVVTIQLPMSRLHQDTNE